MNFPCLAERVLFLLLFLCIVHFLVNGSLQIRIQPQRDMGWS
ncbi:hypothetical protein EV13_1647 [Prochlorococcus sp. MIT 0702]|nr:hypothetical protein EV12_1589 [Prochlorococcus sp. MIT 0701]KGG28235.1 hypothetical protein EV13_1647 [Prochlorococcus sp. MIT 0702]KGG31449.1 hypothetical protein EV14_2240 [Prochlorococcus sp. MIT 0703]